MKEYSGVKVRSSFYSQLASLLTTDPRQCNDVLSALDCHVNTFEASVSSCVMHTAVRDVPVPPKHQ